MFESVEITSGFLKIHKNTFDLYSNLFAELPVLLKFHKSCIQTPLEHSFLHFIKLNNVSEMGI